MSSPQFSANAGLVDRASDSDSRYIIQYASSLSDASCNEVGDDGGRRHAANAATASSCVASTCRGGAGQQRGSPCRGVAGEAARESIDLQEIAWAPGLGRDFLFCEPGGPSLSWRGNGHVRGNYRSIGGCASRSGGTLSLSTWVYREAGGPIWRLRFGRPWLEGSILMVLFGQGLPFAETLHGHQIWPKAQRCTATIKIPKKGVELWRKGKTAQHAIIPAHQDDRKRRSTATVTATVSRALEATSGATRLANTRR
ncbi:hypothetical protein K438DRAFT_1775560 [Mycena galopus ATCC 62051]|nr:hypothetical protein K438DRAFT_1775560 [Mycena galopus ATCC 62051]